MFKRSSQCNAGPAAPSGAARRGIAPAVAAILLAAGSTVATLAAATDLSPVPLPTYTIGSSVDVKPNILMVLDDSGSMDWDFMPDWAVLAYNNGSDYSVNYGSPPDYLRKNAAFNGLAYNPAITYSPPVTFDSNGKNTTKYPSITSNFDKVPNDGFKIQSTSLSNLLGQNNFFHTSVPGEYCDSPALTNCQATRSGKFQYPAPLRWCNSQALTTCRGLWDDTSYKYPKIAAPRISTFTLSSYSSSFSSKSMTSVKVDGLEIMSGTASSTSSTGLATQIANQINACSNKLPSGTNCQVMGYVAESSGNTVTIFAPGVISSTPTVSPSNLLSGSVSAFANSKIPVAVDLRSGSSYSQSTNVVAGDNLRTVIISSNNSYPYPGTNAKASTRTDCAGTTCTYQEEMTNYANWWAYYRTRMQMMKTSASRAFAALDSDEDIAANRTRYRVGYLTLNNNGSSDFVNITDFDKDQKVTWFTQLFKANPNSGTPLRRALSTAGRLYAGKLNGSKLNNVTVTDPMQFSCQKNYTILSTDGYWNGNGGQYLDGTSLDNDNIDGTLPRPYNDGGTATLQTQTSQLQKRTYTLQKRTSSDKGKNWSAWTGVSSCTAVSSGNNRTECRNNNDSGWINASSCTKSGPSANGATTDCSYAKWSSWSNVGSCTPTPQSAGPNYTVALARQCQGVVSGGTKGTLADVAAYYYNTDLRDSQSSGKDKTGTCTGPIISPATTPTDLCSDNVIPFGRDNNPKQHMTTHTLGLGAQGRMVFSAYQNDIDGNRVYVPDYWNQPTGDFYSVANGSPSSPSNGVCTWMASNTTCTWPTPGADDIENIDDLWHAAVNGHGTYFSAQDPASLATALTNVLSQIVNTPRPGTAAAAASSNPNITSTDNYVFSSSYKSVDWYGELIMQQFRPDGTLTDQKWSAMRLLDCAMTSWAANKNFIAGQTYKQGTSCYLVLSDYAAGASFDFGDSGVDKQNAVKLAGGPVTRTIYTVSTSGATKSLTPFTWTGLSAAQQAYFSQPYINYTSATQGLSQFCASGAGCLDATAQAAAAGQALVNYLRGDRTNEGTFFRAREHILGDIVSSEARYVKQPLQNYADAGYTEFKAAQAGRAATVYVGSNDGMLHAFDALTGQERWAFIPSEVLPNLHALADINYSSKHRYFVDGTPEVGDICPTAPTTPCDGTQWKSILVGGMNQGGKTYYALDITNPASPSILWEFTDSTMGNSYSNPRITKLKTGEWVVLVASGYNNTADGKGYLYVLNAATGTLKFKIATSAGTSADPSGLAKLAARAPTSATNNTVTQVYGGDLFGNVWRFDVNGDVGAPGVDAQLLVQLKDPSGNAQPITAKPTVASHPTTGDPMVIVGTGRYLGLSDLNDNNTYSLYAIKDKLDSNMLPTPRTGGSNFVKQSMQDVPCPSDAPDTICSQGQIVRTVTSTPVDWSVKNGWYVDFLIEGERAVTDSTLALGTLVFTTIKPQSTTVSTIIGCNGTDSGTNAKSYLYYVDYLTGGAVNGTKNVVGEELCTCIATRPSVVRAQNGAVEGIIRTSGGAVGGSGTSGTGDSTGDGDGEDGGNGGGNGTPSTDMGYTTRQDLPVSSANGPSRRISYRELNGQ